MAIPRPGAPPPVSENVGADMAYARAARDLQRYEDLVSAMESVVRMKMRLTAEEKELVEIGYRKVMEAKRQERWRLESINAVDDRLIPEVEREMEKICRNARVMVHDHLIPSSTCVEEIVQYHTMIGDFYRYRSESKTTYWNYYASFAYIEYQMAENLALTELTGHNLVRLRLSYNFSTLCYLILPEPYRALGILIKALDAALLSAALFFLDEDSFMIVELLLARLYNWFPPNRFIYIGETPPLAFQNVAQVQINGGEAQGFSVGIIR